MSVALIIKRINQRLGHFQKVLVVKLNDMVFDHICKEEHNIKLILGLFLKP